MLTPHPLEILSNGLTPTVHSPPRPKVCPAEPAEADSPAPVGHTGEGPSLIEFGDDLPVEGTEGHEELYLASHGAAPTAEVLPQPTALAREEAPTPAVQHAPEQRAAEPHFAGRITSLSWQTLGSSPMGEGGGPGLDVRNMTVQIRPA